jgi:hypothetical protein
MKKPLILLIKYCTELAKIILTLKLQKSFIYVQDDL